MIMLDAERQSGFTLVELLVVIATIGILVAIAIPQFSSYRARGFDSHAELALRMVAIAEEAYFCENYVYRTCDTSTCEALLPGVVNIGSGVILQVNATATGFEGTSSHVQGSGRVFSWDS